MAKTSKVIDSLTNLITSKRGLITSGVLSGLATLVTVFFFLFPYYVTTNPSNLLSEEAHVLRENVLKNGEQSTEPGSIASGIRSENIYTLLEPTNGVRLSVAAESDAADYYEFSIDAPWVYEGTNYIMRTYVSTAFKAEISGRYTPFEIEVHVLDENGKQLVSPTIDLPIQVYATYGARLGEMPFLSQASDRRMYFDPEEFERVVDTMTMNANIAFRNLPTYATLFGYKDGKAFVEEAASLYEKVNYIANLSRIATYGSSFAVAFTSLFAGSLILKHTQKKESRDKIRLFSPKLTEEELSDAPPKRQPKESKLEAFLTAHNIKPIFGEWFFRIIGLILVAASSFILSAFARAHYEEWGEGIMTFAENWTEFFENASAVGSFILLIIVIGIISETRMNLHLSAWCFITLAVGNYLFSCSTLFTYQLLSGHNGIVTANNIASSQPGNIFLGIGLFSITGFFLFFNPPKSVINRKAFRAMSLIPTSIALLSVVFTYLYKSEIYTPSYWVRNILFIRDSSIVFMGIIYEYVVFIIYTFLSWRYGEKDARKIGERPYVQFQKNVALCIVILIFTVIFYIIPADQRSFFGFSSTHAFYFLLIPFFLFYKPSGRHYKSISNVIYYAVYAIAWSLPSIPGLVTALLSVIQ